MKLLIVTAVEEFQTDVLKIFKEAKIEVFSSSDIEGYKSLNSMVMTTSWFPGEKGTASSVLFFSFTELEKTEKVFKLIETYNETSAAHNPIRAVVIPVEKNI